MRLQTASWEAQIQGGFSVCECSALFYETVQEEIPVISVLEFTVAIISTNQGDFSLGEGMLTCLTRSKSAVFIVRQSMYAKT